MLSSNLLKSKIPILWSGGWLAEFGTEFKFTQVQNSHFVGEGGGVGGLGWGGGGSWNLVPSSNFLKKPKFPLVGVGGGRGRGVCRI